MSGKRPIFEDVSGDAGDAKTKNANAGMIDARSQGARRQIRAWLLILFAMVVVMIAVGGLTRLTDSGLSITEWKPITGAMPPNSEAMWNEVFEKYQATPEYLLQNKGMSLPEFKFIFWWEWSHRQLGRSIGMVWAIGFFFFLFTRKIPNGWTGRLVGIGALGGLQGAIGWWMVSSGLTGRMVDVASYRLATHLGLAFIILGLIAWFRFLLSRPSRDLLQARRSAEPLLRRLASLLGLVIFAQIIFGALVAGIDAGRNFPTWPSMNGQFLPSGSFDVTPLWRNFFENPGLVQFDHRMLGYFTFLLAAFVWFKSRSSALRATKSAFDWVMAMILVQMTLGIFTVLYAAPWQVAIVHQLGAIVLLVLVLRARFLTQYPQAQSLR